MTATTKPVLRIGVMLNSVQTTAWARHMLATLQASDYASIELLIVDSGAAAVPLQQANIGLQRVAGSLASRAGKLIYERFIDKFSTEYDAFALADITSQLPDTPILEVDTIRKRVSDYIPQADVQQIKSCQLDVIIRVGFRILRGDILQAAKHGVWSYHHGDSRVNRGGPPGFWEMMQSWPETGSVLQILSEELDNGRVLYRSYSATDRFSLKSNRNRLYWKTQAFIPRMLKRLHRDGQMFYDSLEPTPSSEPAFYSQRLYQQPTQIEYFKLVCKKALEKISWILHNKTRLRQWVLMFDLADGLSTSPWRYKTITPPADRFWADPHILQRDGIYYVFIEELLYASGRGHISVMEIDQQGQYSTPRPILEKPYHLSYPFVFEHDGETWMIPESEANRTVELYHCVEFPDRWEWVMNLMEDCNPVDATLYFHDGLWWMFVNQSAHPSLDRWDELYVYYASDFRTTDWTPHPLNPIVSDVKSARPAGKLFMHDGKLIRPAQNCSNFYGYGFSLNEVQVLNPTDYREQLMSAVTPNWRKDVVATHTFNQSGRLSIIDAMLARRR